MKRGKKIHFISYGALIFFVAILIGFVIYQQDLLKTRPQSTKIDDSKGHKSEVAADNSFVEPEKNRNNNIASDEINELKYQLEASEEELVITRNKLFEEQDKNQDLIDAEYDRLHSPAARNQRRRAIEKEVSNTFGPMLNNLGIYGEKRSALSDLLAERKLAYMDISEELSGYQPGAEKLDEEKQQREIVDNEIAEKIGELIGKEIKSKVISNFPKESEIELVAHFAENLGVGDMITDKQNEELVDSLYEARIKFFDSYYKNINEGTAMPGLNDENIINFEDQINEAYLNSTKTILSESQYELLKNYFEQRKKTAKKPDEL